MVARSPVDDVAALLAADRVAAGVERLEHGAVADGVVTTRDAGRAIAWRKPRLLITVTTTVSSVSGPASRSCSAPRAIIRSPSTMLP